MHVLVIIVVLAPFYKLNDFFLNAPPGLLENLKVYKMMHIISYATYYWGVSFIAVLLHVIPLIIVLGNINKWKKIILIDSPTKKDIFKINKIRKKCNNIPYYVILAEILFPIIVVSVLFILTILIGLNFHIHIAIQTLKLFFIFFSIYCSIGIISFIFAKKICKIILLNIDIDGSYPGLRVPFRNSLAFQMLLMFTVGIMLTSLAGYSKLIEEKGDLLFGIYKEELENNFDKNRLYTIDEIKNKFE